MRGDKDARSWRRGYPAAVAGLAMSALALSLTAAGVTSAVFSATETVGHNSFTAATVTLANGAVANCPISSLLPNATPGSCTFTTTYPGPLPAYLAVDVLIETQAGSSGTALYNPADAANDLQVTITSSNPSVSYTVPTAATTCPGGAPSGLVCYELDNELISTSPVTSAAASSTVSAMIPVTSPGYQGGTAQVILTTHAVQAANNTLSCSAAPAAGSPCTPSGTFKWN
jgi:predicted ribosomally synthesized peptide with SipW-like signal peptide